MTPPFDRDATPSQTDLSASELEAIRALAGRIHNINGYERRVKALASRKEENEVAKAAWVKWFWKVHPWWNMLKDVELMLDTYDRHPRLMVDGQGGAGSVRGHSWCQT